MIHHGDCIDWLATLDAKSVDHVITDPPYESEAHSKGRRCRGAALPGGRRTLVAVPIDFAPMDEVLRDRVSLEIARVTKRWALVFCQLEGAMLWRTSLETAGLAYRRTLIWTKPDGQPQLTGDRPGMGYECAVAMHRRGRSRWNGGGRLAVYVHNKRDPVTPYAQPNDHPTQKPVPLMLDLVRDFTDRDDLIIDPFAGSGTTGVAALRLGRRFLGCERDAKYARLAADRLSAEQRDSTLQAFQAGQTPLFGVT